MTCRWGLVVAASLVLWPLRAQAQPAVAADPAPITGQRISLDLKGVDILDVLKLLSQKSGFNFVAGKNVSGRVTIFVNDVDVWDALNNDQPYRKAWPGEKALTYLRDHTRLFFDPDLLATFLEMAEV